MRVLPTALALCTVLVSPASVFAAGSGRQAPYKNLFTAQFSPASPVPPRTLIPMPAPQFVPSPAASSAGAQTIVCGMTVLQADSKIDPAIVHRTPANAPRPLITVIQPQICRP